MLFMRFERNKLIIMNVDGFLDCGAVQLSLNNRTDHLHSPGELELLSWPESKLWSPLAFHS